MRDARDSRTLDLLDWEPSDPAVRFDDREIRGATLEARLCRAMAVALDQCKVSREVVASKMSAYLGREVSKAMLDAYVSEARTTHTINVVRFAAFIHATGDWRLLSLLPELFGFRVVEERFISLIRAQQIREKAVELERMAAFEERRARGTAR